MGFPLFLLLCYNYSVSKYTLFLIELQEILDKILKQK